MKYVFSAPFSFSHRFLFQEQPHEPEKIQSPEDLSVKEKNLQEIQELVNTIEEQFVSNRIRESAIQEMVDTQLEPLLKSLDTPEEVKQAVQRLTALGFEFDDILTAEEDDGLRFKDTQKTTLDIQAPNLPDYYTYLKKNPSRYVSKESPLNIDGRELTLKDISQNDLRSVDRADIKTVEDLSSALEIAHTKGKVEGKLSDIQVKQLFYFLQNGIEFDGNVELMQDILVALDPSLKGKLKQNGKIDDGKYGYATSEAVQNLASELSDYVDKTVELNVPTVKDNIERMFAGREKIILLLDVTASMTEQINALSEYIDSEVLQKNPEAQIDIRVFDENGLMGMSVPFRSENREAVLQKLRNIPTGGGGDAPEPIFNATSVLMDKAFQGLSTEERAQNETEGLKNRNLVLVFSDATSKPLNYINNDKYEVDTEEVKNMRNRIPKIQEKARLTGTDVVFFTPDIKNHTARISTVDDVVESYKGSTRFHPTGMASAGVIKDFGKKEEKDSL